MYLFVWVYGRENIQYSAQKKEGSIKLGNKSPHVQGTAVADYSTGLTWKMHISVNNRSYEHQYKCRLPPTKDKRIHQRTIPLPPRLHQSHSSTCSNPSKKGLGMDAIFIHVAFSGSTFPSLFAILNIDNEFRNVNAIYVRMFCK